MSLLRYMLNDLRPLVRMLDEPLIAPTRTGFTPFRSSNPFAMLESELNNFSRQPALEVEEDGKDYLVEAELPGVRKEDVEVRVGEGGRSLTIEGKVARRGPRTVESQSNATSEANGASTDNATVTPAASDSQAVTETTPAQPPAPYSSFTSTFSRTVTFPRPVSAEGVTAKLENGILSLRVPQAVEQGSVRINVD